VGAVDNSLEAFERAISVGADMIEFDVRRTRDDCLVAFHDAGVGGVAVGRLTREEIGAYTGHAPPLLEEVLELAEDRVALDVELKEDGYVSRVLESLDGRFAPDRMIITSFLDSVVGQVKRQLPNMQAGLLIGVPRPGRYLHTRYTELFPVRRARACGVDYLAPHVDLVRLGVLARAQAAGLPALVWTVNEDRAMSRLFADERVAGVITDVPQRALEVRDAIGSTSEPSG
jgi:glycerophosphoryl diester phosphodiesterase